MKFERANLVQPVVNRREVVVRYIKTQEINRMCGKEKLVRRIENHLPAKVVALKSSKRRNLPYQGDRFLQYGMCA